MDQHQFNSSFIEFLNDSPTPFHAVAEMSQRLLAANFQQLNEGDHWSVKPGQGYFVTRNQSSIVAFRIGSESTESTGLRMVGAHTDSPCLKVKPSPVIGSRGYIQLGVEVYGGVLMHPWFDRDLSLAGRVNYTDKQGRLRRCLVDFKEPIATIPSLAIHLNREANSNNTINPQQHLIPIILQERVDDADLKSAKKTNFEQLLMKEVLLQDASATRILSHELCFYDTQSAALTGLNKEFLAGARLDNLLSCFAGLSALLSTQPNSPSCLLVCNDHEEVGSASAAGAQGPFLKAVLERIVADRSDYHRTVSNSLLFSTDNAHGIHPNYADRHDANHEPILNAGPVVKINANQRYASNSESVAFFNRLCDLEGIPRQMFVSRNDMSCGSTIGPLTAAELGVRTLDLGVPTLAMHSIRELAGCKDAFHLQRLLTAFFEQEDLGIIN